MKPPPQQPPAPAAVDARVIRHALAAADSLREAHAELSAASFFLTEGGHPDSLKVAQIVEDMRVLAARVGPVMRWAEARAREVRREEDMAAGGISLYLPPVEEGNEGVDDQAGVSG